jgi:outer membrane protein assembly factor BamD (BamD/ComL family)
MNRAFVRLSLVMVAVMILPCNCPAPLVYRAGEGWTYEPVGGGRWQRARAKDQLEVAQTAFDKKQFGLALKAARRTVRKWPLSDYAPQAQYLVGRCYEAKRQDQKAFKEYQTLLEKYPKVANYQDVVRRQYEIANRFLAGEWIKLWGVIPFFPSMDKTAEMYTKLIKNGLYSDVAPQAQMNIGAAREKQKDYPQAVKAYELAADRYNDQEKVASDALYKAGVAYMKQAQKAEYDQGAAFDAIDTFNRFVALYPNDKRVKDAQQHIDEMKTEQARGAFEIARYYEKKQRWLAAQIYYNEAAGKDPTSKYAAEAKRRIDAIKQHTTPQPEKKQSPTSGKTEGLK